MDSSGQATRTHHYRHTTSHNLRPSLATQGRGTAHTGASVDGGRVPLGRVARNIITLALKHIAALNETIDQSFALEPSHFRFQFCNAALQLLNDRRYLLLRKSFVNVLTTVHIPGFNFKQDGSLRLARIGRVTK